VNIQIEVNIMTWDISGFDISWFDIAFLLVLFVIQPLYSRHAWLKLQRAIAAGVYPDRVVLYRQTMLGQWIGFAVLLAGWWWLDRSWDDLGLHGDTGTGFLVVAVLGLVTLGVLAFLALRLREAPAETKQVQRERLGDLEPFLPQDDRDLRSFFALSVTAGIVEELLYRGFVLWVLVQWMPLWPAVLLSSLAFGLAHSYQGAGGMLRTGLIGLLFAVLFVASGSIWLPMLLHALFDIVQGVQIRELFRESKPGESATARA
jgi:membrane protease YdiL (CAAX protease family)